MESSIVNIILLIFCLFHDCYSADDNVREIILIEKEVPIKNDKVERETFPQEIYQRKPLDIEIETFWGNRTIGIFKDIGCIIQTKLLSFKDNYNFRYCLTNELLQVKKEKDPFLRINLIDKSTKFVKQTTDNFLRVSEMSKAEKREKIFNKNCKIHFDLYCDDMKNNETSNYREKFFNPVIIDNYNDNADFTPEKELIQRINSSGYEEIKFEVNKSTIEIHIVVNGNLSCIGIEIPIGNEWYNTAPITLLLARKNDTDEMEIVALNAPPGGWFLKLTGEGASKYSFLVKKIKRKIDKKDLKLDEDRSLMWHHNDTDSEYRIVSNTSYEETQSRFDNVEVFDEPSEASRLIILNDESSEFSETRNKRNEIEKDVENFHDALSSIQIEENEKIQLKSFNDRSSKIIFENDGVQQTNVNVSNVMKNINKQEHLNEFARLGDDEKEEKRRIIVKLNENSNLFVRPGTIHRIVFDVTNNHYQTIRCDFKVRSLPLIVFNIQPIFTWIFAGRTINVFVDVEVPRRTSQDVINTLTLYVQGSEIMEKSVYLYVEGNFPNIVDDTKPAIEYMFNNNCAGKLSKEKCTKSRWSVDIRIQDSESGLKNVKSSPNEIYPRTDFISGTRNPVTFYYSATCCSTQAKITATDLKNNYNTYTIDVTAWNNLSEGEIAAITVGALLILLLIILIIVIIVFCVRKRKSHDLPYTQRYGSRAPARAERTSF
ncbi:uncharacterized protein LOC118446779 isoform X1 [Vespa mandarinia]|uniref:uncharacterized protein LOC118446779 isoform X1 n=1 Tax=Vespa mandarinia TaxID=7446 RepID=UPI00161A7928|nr:uncharacterized protein LOC118446779 isoform X1 [Vespa mandarinia]